MKNEKNILAEKPKPYSKPTLTKYERLQDLTHGASTFGNGPTVTCDPFSTQCTDYVDPTF